MNYLAVCLGNHLRSPYVAEWIGEYCSRRGINVEAKSAGLLGDSPVVLDASLIEWADSVVTMERYMESLVLNKSRRCSKMPNIFCLDVPDKFYPDWYANAHRSARPNEPLIDDAFQGTPEEADARLKEILMHERFGSGFFSKVLEVRLAPYIEKMSDHKEPSQT